jgi:hypothetical protein
MLEITILVSESTGKTIRARKGEESVKPGDLVIVESEHGGDLAAVVDDSSAHCKHPYAARGAVQIAFCSDRIRDRALPMKLVEVRYFFNEKKGIFYYTADGRIDFRELVKDLAKELRMRIEMRQVGVRDEAKMLGGLGVCGRQLCCHSFMKTFEPVTIQKARRQQIVINPTKISGLCGRLMCCLAFEEQSRGRLHTVDNGDQIED